MIPSLSYLQNCENLANCVYQEYQDGKGDIGEVEYYDDRVAEFQDYHYKELGIDGFIQPMGRYSFSWIESRRTILRD